MKKKLNPRRIPLPKAAIKIDEIVEEAMKDDMYHSWLVVAEALVNLEYVNAYEVQSLCDEVNEFSKKDADSKALAHAESLMGIGPRPRLDISRVKSPIELEKFKRKVTRVAMYTSLAVICLGLEKTGKFSKDDLHRIFFSADITLAEIDAGTDNYEEIEQRLLNQMVKIEPDEDL